MNSIQFQRIQAQARRAGWEVQESSISNLPAYRQKMLLGCVPPQGYSAIKLRERAGHRAAHLKDTEGYGAYDLRGAGFVTPVKDQGNCGSCVAFAMVAAAEATYQMQENKPNSGIDLSEAHLFFCYAGSEGRTCGNGWWMESALAALEQGLVSESDFPYHPGDQSCPLAGQEATIARVTGSQTLRSISQMEHWIRTRGALSACLSVYQDLFYYGGGIYRQTSDAFAGLHAVCVVGFNSDEGYWIVKNSWGYSWGDSGYFKIAYGECGIDASMWAIEGVESSFQAVETTTQGRRFARRVAALSARSRPQVFAFRAALIGWGVFWFWRVLKGELPSVPALAVSFGLFWMLAGAIAGKLQSRSPVYTILGRSCDR